MSWIDRLEVYLLIGVAVTALDFLFVFDWDDARQEGEDKLPKGLSPQLTAFLMAVAVLLAMVASVIAWPICVKNVWIRLKEGK